jgi:hypothetical protein
VELVEHLTHIEVKKCTQNGIGIQKQQYLEDLSMDGKIILKLIFGKEDSKVWNGWI